MTIKPVLAPTQKRGSTADVEKKEHGGHAGSQTAAEQQNHSQQNVGVRASASLVSHRNVVIDGLGRQSPQRRVEIFDEISRHRRSPHKSTRNKRRDLHDHPLHKRDRAERAIDKHCNVATSKSSSPRPHAAAAVVAAGGNNGGNSPGVVKAAEQLTAIPGILGCQSSNSQTVAAQAAVNLLKAVEDNYAGYNSGDEHLQAKEALITEDEWQQRDEQFSKCMSERGYVLKAVEEDGACLFRAISLQIYGDEEMHDVIRQHTMDYILKNREYFSHFVTEDINSYIKRKRRQDSHGNHIEIQAMSEIYSRPVEVYCYKPTPINIFNSEQLNNGYAPLRLSYQRGSHYNAIIDPYNATVGVGLGLAGYKPEMQTKEAVLLSEQVEIEQTMFEDKLKTTDWEATNEAIEEQIARESYLQWCRENLQKTRSNAPAASSSSTTTSATVTSAEADAEASPSKYAMQRSGCDGTAKAANTCSTQGAVAFGAESTLVSSAVASISTVVGFSSKSVTLNLRKESIDVGLDSDDTDISSNSGNSSPTAAATIRAKKSKNRSGLLRSVKKRRRDVIVNANTLAISASNKDSQNLCKIAHKEVNLKTHAGVKELRACSADTEQQPSTSKQLSKKSTEKSFAESTPMSSLYQELLEASYTVDGFQQLSESEMLQRAIQMSTHDYIEDQKRKYFLGPSN